MKPIIQRRNEGRRIQQRAIADRAGVSVSTVSRVLNNTGQISTEVQRRVLEAAAELGYALEALRPRHRLQQITLLGRAVPDLLLDTFHSDILNGVEAECRAQGIQLNYAVAGEELGNSDTLKQRLKQNPVDGLLLMSITDRTLIEPLIAMGLPLGLINSYHRALPVDNVRPDNFTGALLATRHLIAYGHRRILHINRHPNDIPMRLQGYRAALEEAGIPHDPSLEIVAPGNADEARALLRAVLPEYLPRISAIFCATDPAAIAALGALHELGHQVPRDISLVGFTDIPTVAFVNPPLTSVRIERRELGAIAVRRLIERVLRPHIPPLTIEVGCRVIERESVAPPRVDGATLEC